MRLIDADKIILDATCGTRSIWFDKECSSAIFHDRREGIAHKKFGKKRYERTMIVSPDICGDFRHMPFPDETFYHVVFDPPHAHINESAWMYKMYGTLPEEWEALIHDGFRECMRVLKPYGTLIFKWSDVEISTREVINAIGCEPLYGHRSGKKMNTHWMCFIKGVTKYDNQTTTYENDGHYTIMKIQAGKGVTVKDIDEAPTIEAEPVRYGVWLEYPEDWRNQIIGNKCSLCGFAFFGDMYKYCPHCGAKMDGGA